MGLTPEHHPQAGAQQAPPVYTDAPDNRSAAAPAAAIPPPAATPVPPPQHDSATVGGLQKAVLGSTFLSGAEMTAEMLLEAGKEVPMVGPLLTLMLAFINALKRHRANKEECERLAVWVHALMGSISKAARGGTVDADTMPLVDAAATAMQTLMTLVNSRLNRKGGWFRPLAEFWKSSEFKEGVELAAQCLRDALDA